MGEKDFSKLNEIAKKLPSLEGDAKILYEAYKEFAKNGITHDEMKTLANIDAVLKDASIQITKNGVAIIVDDKGKITKV